MTFARRLIAGTVAVLLITVLVLVVSAERWLRADLERELSGNLERQASLLHEALPQDSLDWGEFATRFGAAAGIRVTLMDRTGRVRADTDVPATELSQVENHAARPEMAAALAGRVGQATRASSTIGRSMMYVAIPVRPAAGRLAGGGSGGLQPAVIRVAMPLDLVDAVVGGAQRSVLIAALLALAFGGLLAWAAGRSIARPLTETALAARAIAAGNTPQFPRSGIPDVDAMVGALRSMHEQLDARFDALTRRQAETEALVNAMVEGVLSCDARGRVLTANPAARRLLGYPTDQQLPELRELFHQKSAREVVDATLRGETIPDREIVLDDRTCLVSARPLPGGGAVLVLHDLTELRRLEVIRRDFVANVSHELKTPLTSISGYAETLLSEGVGSETSKRFLETILANAHRMQQLVDDQLDLSRIESGTWRATPVPIATEPALREAWPALESPAASRHLFDVTVAAGAETLLVDPGALRQVLSNLYDNARRYTPDRGRIVAAAVADQGGVRVSVGDTGSGISSEHLPRIFERFYRADPSRSRAEGGTGLGLAIVKHLVESHGGRVWAESSLGRGTAIHCWFPGEARS